MSESGSPLFTPPDSPVLPSLDTETASTDGPSIPGLYYFPDFLKSKEAQQIVEDIIDQAYFDVDQQRDQAVLFGSRGVDPDAGLPLWTRSFLSLIESRLRDQERLPSQTIQLLFPSKLNDINSISHDATFTRQLILNCYQPGQGISSHVDLPHKFLDGIMIFSFGSSITMTFEKVEKSQAKHSVYLLPNSLCILSGESRWQWNHGIPSRDGDWIWQVDTDERKYCRRGQRLSITVRWYKFEDNDGYVPTQTEIKENNYEIEDRVKDTNGTGERNSDARLSASCNG